MTLRLISPSPCYKGCSSPTVYVNYPCHVEVDPIWGCMMLVWLGGVEVVDNAVEQSALRVNVGFGLLVLGWWSCCQEFSGWVVSDFARQVVEL